MNRFLLKEQVVVLVFSLITYNLFSQQFVEQTGIALTGVEFSSTDWGDYDNDGDLDIILTGMSDSEAISKIYRNNGDNTFTEQTGIVLHGVYFGSAAWGDYDGDGDLDILLTGSGISKIYRNNGDNTFTEQTDIVLTGVAYSSVAWGDYDNDGDLDILLTGRNNLSQPFSRIYRNNGNNTFTEQTGIVLTGVYYSSVAWGDYDNDGDLDILLTGRNSLSQSFSRIYRNNGNDSFTEQTDIELTGVVWGSTNLGDYDNDGDLDIIITGSSGSEFISKIYRNNGDNNFIEQTHIELTGVNLSSVSWGDYDNDGDLDLLLTGWTGSGDVSKIYQNNGDNTFTEQTNITLVEVEASSAVWGDYDNDGDLDILLTGVDYNNNGIRVSRIYRNDITSPNVEPSTPSNLQAIINNGVVTFTWDKPLDTETPQNGLSYNLYIYENGQSSYECPPHAFNQADLKNGRRLIAKMGTIQWRSGGYTIKELLSNKTYNWSVQAVDAGFQGSNFSAEQNFSMPFYRPVTQANYITFNNIQTTQGTATWINGGGIRRAVFLKTATTGVADLVDNTYYNVNDITPGGWKCVYNGSDNSMVLTGLIPDTDYILHVCEYNGATGNETYLNSTAYQNPAILNTIFNEQTGISLSGVENSSATWGDYDKDGDLDILLTGSSSSGYICKIYRNNGNNTFTEQTEIAFTGVMSGSVAWGDYDNDCDLDILLSGSSSSAYVSKIYHNNGNGTFTEQTDIILPGIRNSSVAWGDYDNDGDLDILLTGTTSSYVSGAISKIYRNNGDHTFTEQTGIAFTGVMSGSAAWGDYDKDSDLDIILTGSSGSGFISKIYRNNSDNSFTEQTNIALTGVANSSVAWGDYDNDGNLDIILSGSEIADSHKPVSKIYRNNGNNIFTEQTSISLTGVAYSSVAWGDYDNDGDLDILLTGYNSSYRQISKIYRNNGDNSFTEQAGITMTGVKSGSVAWGDYDNDGNLDILLTGSSVSGNISNIIRNGILNQNIQPSAPTGLQSYWINDQVVFKWIKSSDNTTPAKIINYNLRIGISPGGNEIKSAQALATGKLLLTITNNMIKDTCMKLRLPLNKYYWSVQAVDNGGLASSFAAEEITPSDSIQAEGLQAFRRTSNSMQIRWKNGNGLRRILFGRLSSSAGNAKPVNGTIYNAEPYFGQGDRIGTTGWYCMYNGKADSAVIYGLGEGYSYDIQVIEYIENNKLPQYFSTVGNGNPGVFSISLFSEQTGIALPVVRFGSAVWSDHDNDGDLDILLTGAAGSFPNYIDILKIYNNNGDNTFTEQFGIDSTGVSEGSIAWGDYDNDEDLDILVAGNGISRIYRNDGNNTFTEQIGIELTGVAIGSLAWGDYDNDGDLDILLTGSSSSGLISKIYRNNSDNSFTEQTGIALTGVYGSSVAWGDYDNDGDLDILLTGWNSSYVSVSKIYRNNGNNSFTEQTNISLKGVADGLASWGDYDNDCDLDILLIGALSSGGRISIIYRNNGENSFTEQTGIELTGGTGISAWGDYDNDGYMDILLTASGILKIYHNNGNNSFTEQTSILLTSSNSFALGDYDNDGDLDMLIDLKVYRNNTYMKAGDYSANKKPAAPVNLKTTSQPDGTILSWSPLKTDETSYKTMTYNIQVSTTQSGSNICSPQADTSGYRRIVAMGNAQLDTTFLIKNLATTKYYWSVQAVDQGYAGGAWSAVDSFEVRNVQAFFSNYEVCLGYPTHFIDQSAATEGIAAWRWDFKDGGTSVDQNPVHTYSASGTYNVKLVITDNNGLKDSLEHSVIVRPKPLASFTAPNVCQGIPVTATNTTNNNGLTINSWYWDFGDGSKSASEQPGPHGYLNPGDYTIKLKAVASNGCADSVTSSVSVGAYPIAAVTANAPLTFCKGDSVTLSVPYDSSYTYEWKMGEVYITGAESSGYVAKFTGTFSVKIVNPKGNCSVTSSGIAINVLDAPAAPLISVMGDTTFCQGDSVILSVTNTLNSIYQWKNNGGAVGTNSNKYTAKNSGKYNLTVTNINGCSVNSTDSVTVIVNPAPSAGNISSSSDTTFCQGSTVTLSVPSSTGNTYRWKNEFGVIPGAVTNSYTAGITGKYRLEVTNSAGCNSETRPVNINVKPSPSKPSVTSSNYSPGECPGKEPIMLSDGTAVPGYKYTWIKDGEPRLNDTLTHLEFYEKGIYKLKAAMGDCVSESDPVTITLPDAPEKPKVYVKGPVVWYMAAESKTADRYQWYRNGELITGATKYIYVANKTLGTYKVAVGNQNNCYTMSDERTIPTSKSEMTDFHIPKEYLIRDGIDPFESLQIYPNPTTGVFTIEMDNDIFGELNIEIITEQGKEIKNILLEKATVHYKTEIGLSSESRGLYFINLRIDNYFATRKIILE